MKCEKVRDLILTDYLDGRMAEDDKRELELHLAGCSRCRELSAATKKVVAGPFSKAERVSPPESVWHDIRDTIKAGERGIARRPAADFLGKLRSFLAFPRPAFAVATVAVAILLAVFIARLPAEKRVVLNDYLDEQVTFLVSLDTDVTDTYNGDSVDLGTSVEEYLL